jgi:hypothetical protein
VRAARLAEHSPGAPLHWLLPEVGTVPEVGTGLRISNRLRSNRLRRVRFELLRTNAGDRGDDLAVDAVFEEVIQSEVEPLALCSK